MCGYIIEQVLGLKNIFGLLRDTQGMLCLLVLQISSLLKINIFAKLD